MTAEVIRFPRPHRARLNDVADIFNAVFGEAAPSDELTALLAELDRAIVSGCPQTMGLVADRVAAWDAKRRA